MASRGCLSLINLVINFAFFVVSMKLFVMRGEEEEKKHEL